MSCDLELNQVGQWLDPVLALREKQAEATWTTRRGSVSLLGEGGGAREQTPITQNEPNLQVQSPTM